MVRWMSVLAIVIAALVLSGTMLQSMNVVDFRQLALRGAESIPALQEPLRTYQVGVNSQRLIEEQRQRADLLEQELKAMRAEIDVEWDRIKEAEEQLLRREEELNQVSRQLDARAQAIDDRVKNFQDLERLQDVYSTMRPRDLAPILSEMEDPIVALLLSGMGERQIAAVLAEVEPTRAARLSKMVGGISGK